MKNQLNVIFNFFYLFLYGGKKLENKLNELELKFGGLQKNIKRSIKSNYEKKYYIIHQGGDRMNSIYHNYSKIYSAYLLKFLDKKLI